MRDAGYNDALTLLGIEKTAGIGQGLRTAGSWLRSKLPTAQGVKEFMIGRPTQLWDEVRTGKALKPGSLIRESLRPQNKLDKALFVGLPAYEMARTTFDDEGDKLKRMGAIAGGNLLGLAAWKPLGLVGSMGAGMLGDMAGGAIGGGIGKGVDLVTGKTQQNPSGNLAPYVY